MKRVYYIIPLLKIRTVLFTIKIRFLSLKFRTVVALLFCLVVQSCKENSTQVINKVGTWTKVESGVSAWLYDTDFADEQNGWVVGDSGVILNTKDGGETWNKQVLPTQELFTAVDFVDRDYGWCCGRSSILRTTNGGESWESKYGEDLEDGRFRDLKFFDRNVGFVVGGRGFLGSIGVLMKTENGGETWQKFDSDTLPTLTSISIAETNIWICGYGGTILSTTDAGLAWTEYNLNVSPLPSFTVVQFVDKYNGWVGSRDDYLGFYITNNGGKNWVRISEESFKIIGGVLSFYFIDKNKGWMCNFPFDRILKTTDRGLTWQYDSEIRQRINSLLFLTNGIGWAIGSNGSILRYSGTTVIR